MSFCVLSKFLSRFGNLFDRRWRPLALMCRRRAPARDFLRFVMFFKASGAILCAQQVFIAFWKIVRPPVAPFGAYVPPTRACARFLAFRNVF